MIDVQLANELSLKDTSDILQREIRECSDERFNAYEDVASEIPINKLEMVMLFEVLAKAQENISETDENTELHTLFLANLANKLLEANESLDEQLDYHEQSNNSSQKDFFSQ